MNYTMKTSKWILAATVVLALGLACGRMEPIGSRFVKSATVQGDQAVIEVQAGEELALNGTRLEIPKGAVNGAVKITLELGFESLTQEAAGPVAIWLPSGLKFGSKATLRLPIDLPEGASTADVYVEVLEESGERKQLTPTSVENGFVTVLIDGFTSFQPALRRRDGGQGGGSGDGGAGGGQGGGGGGDAGAGGGTGGGTGGGQGQGGGMGGGTGTGGGRGDGGMGGGTGTGGGRGDGGIGGGPGDGGFGGGPGDGGFGGGPGDGGFGGGPGDGGFGGGGNDGGVGGGGGRTDAG